MDTKDKNSKKPYGQLFLSLITILIGVPLLITTIVDDLPIPLPLIITILVIGVILFYASLIRIFLASKKMIGSASLLGKLDVPSHYSPEMLKANKQRISSAMIRWNECKMRGQMSDEYLATFDLHPENWKAKTVYKWDEKNKVMRKYGRIMLIEAGIRTDFLLSYTAKKFNVSSAQNDWKIIDRLFFGDDDNNLLFDVRYMLAFKELDFNRTVKPYLKSFEKLFVSNVFMKQICPMSQPKYESAEKRIDHFGGDFMGADLIEVECTNADPIAPAEHKKRYWREIQLEGEKRYLLAYADELADPMVDPLNSCTIRSVN